jgi:hypothetical protein
MKEDKYLVCIDNSNTIMLRESINKIELTIGKSYKVLNESHYMITNGFYTWRKRFRVDTITIVDDSLVARRDYRLERFITLQQWREQQLNKILDETR